MTDRKASGLKALRPLLPYFGPYRWQLVLGLVMVITSSAVSGVIPWFLRVAIDALRTGAPLSRIWTLALEMVGVAFISGAARYGMRELLNGISRRVEYDLRNDLFAHLETLDATYYGRTRTGDLMARMTNDLGAVRMAAGPAIMYLVSTVAGGLVALAFMLRISGRLTAWALLPMILLPVVMVRFGTLIHDRFEEVQEHFGTLTTRAQENIAGVRVVRAYRQEGPEIDRFGALNDEYLTRNLRLVRLWGIMNPGFGLLAGIATAIVLGYGGALTLRGTITVGALVAFFMYLGMLTWPLIALGWVINLFQRAAASMARLNEITRARSAVQSPVAARALPPARAGREIEFRNVGFHYPTPTKDGTDAAATAPTVRWVLRGVSFRVPAGATLGVVGATGSGKSALIDLIPRLYDPQEGEILIDGVPTRELPIEALRGEIGYVPQESFLFSDTVGANLRYGMSAAPEGGDRGEGGEAEWAARVAQIRETIERFPGRYDTLLGERGINLSGGQKQRVALARALARRPHVVLLDDALSAVDSHTEAEILHALRDALGGRTAVIASHRISAIRDASWIIVLDEGRVVEQGRHEDLLAAGGRYWSLLNRQQLVDAIEDDGDGSGGEGEVLATNDLASRLQT